jgi:hypothetical protein
MNDEAIGSRAEVERIRRVSDQLCTAHAALRDRCKRRATVLDIAILLSSAWLTALAFVDPGLEKWLIPFGIDSKLWIGLFGVVVFFVTLIQFKMDWGGKAEAHARSFNMYAEVKREAGYMLASNSDIPAREFQRLAARYDMASDVGTGVPESAFLKLKRQHLMKVRVSKILDQHPGSSVLLTKLKVVIGDNFSWPKRWT